MSTPGLFGILQQIAEATDEETAVKIAEEFGGYQISVPKSPSENTKNKLVLLIGVDKTKMIADYVGTGDIKIPQGGFVGTTANRRKVIEMTQNNIPVFQIIKETGYSERQITRIRKAFREVPSLPLFDGLD